MFVEGEQIAQSQSFEPALRVQTPQRVVAGAFGVADLGDFMSAANKAIAGAFSERGFLSANAKYDFVTIAERTWLRSPAGAGEFEALVAEGDFSGGEDGGFGFGEDGLNFFD
jgi:hypothetical protein